MICIGVESTAHTLGLSVVEAKGEKVRVLLNKAWKYPSTSEGYIPFKLAEHHSENAVLLAEELKKMKSLKPDLISYSQGPGIGHSLHVGFVIARTLSYYYDVPLVPVNHAVAHIEIGKSECKTRNPLIVYVSGGNTQIIVQKKKYEVVGETMDMGLGNMLDQLGRKLGLNPPDAVGVLKEASKTRRFVFLPYTVKGMNFSFTGLLTAALKLKESREVVCYSTQETAFSMLVEACERALCHYHSKEVLLVGGNARNKRLQEMLRVMSREHHARFCVPSDEYCGDNAAMIALSGLVAWRGRKARNVKPRQKMRVDEGFANKNNYVLVK
jgi:N6-L-threonylcarbamoyladenine synthase/protein kinase Bud32